MPEIYQMFLPIAGVIMIGFENDAVTELVQKHLIFPEILNTERRQETTIVIIPSCKAFITHKTFEENFWKLTEILNLHLL